MNKKAKLIVSIVCILCLALTICLSACTQTVTLTLYDNDGKTVLHTIKVESGGTAEKPTDPSKDGFIFTGWFVTPTSSKAFDFEAPLTEDAKAYAQWKTAGFQDDRDWVLSGSINNWGGNLEGYHLTKKDGTGNVYELTLDLHIGDEFQLTVLLADGSLSYSSEGARAASSHVVAGTEYMEAAGGLGTYKNIHIIQDGNYTLSLLSDPETDNNELTIIRNGDPIGAVVEHEIVNYAIKGSKVTGWADSTAVEHLMSKNADGKFVLTIELYANDEFMFVGYEMVDAELKALSKYIKSDMLADGSAAEVAAKAGGNFTTSANGTYTFTFDPATEKISVSYSPDFSLEKPARPTTWYILGNGSVADSVLNKAAWGLADEEAQGFVDKGNGVYELTLDLYVGDAFKICSSSSWANARDFSFMVNPGENFKANGNIEVLVAGNYTLTLTVDADDETKDTITWVRNGDAAGGQEQQVTIDAFAIKGSKVTGWADSTAAEHLMNKNTDGKYVLTIQLYANDEFMFVAYQMVDGTLTGLPIYIKSDMIAEGSAAEVQAKAGGNFTTSANGTYTFTYDHEAKSVVITYSADFSLEVVARPTTWYILGNGTVAGSVLNNAAWGLKDETAQGLVSQGNGVYKITLDLYAGDEFQICSSSSWSDKHGFSSLVNPGENFTQGGNITVAVAGNYTLTLTVDADDETKDKIEWVRNGDAAQGGEQEEYPADAFAIKGSKVTGWADKTDAQYLMNKNTDGKFVLTIELYANDEFMFVGYEMVDDALSALALYIKSDVIAEGSAAEVQAKAGGNFTTSANGTYTFTFDPETNKVHIAYSSDFSLEVVARPTTWYILGNSTVDGAVLKTSSWGLNDESVQKLVDKGNGVYEITLNLYAGDEFQICSNGSWSDKHGFSSLVNPGENFTQGGNITVAVAGNYTLTLTIDAEDETKDTITWVRNGDCQ